MAVHKAVVETPTSETRQLESNGAEAVEPDPIVIRMPVDVRSIALTIVAVAALLIILRELATVFIPILFAILINYTLTPVVDRLERLHVPRAAAAALVVTVLASGLVIGGYALAGQAMTIVEGVPEAAQRLRSRLEQGRNGGEDGALEKVQEAAAELEVAAGQASAPAAPRRPGVQRVEVVEPPFRATDYLWAGGMSIVGLLGQLAVVMFLAMFILGSGDMYKRKLVRITGPTLARKKLTVQILDEINTQIGQFVRAQVLANVIVAAATTVVLWWLGVEHYVIWGLVAGVFNSIPYFGPALVTAALGVVAFLQFDDVWRTFYVCAATGAITTLEGMALQPALMSRASQINPVAIFVGLLLWSWLWGLWGTVLAVPILMMVKAVSDRVESLQPLGELLGGEPKSASPA